MSISAIHKPFPHATNVTFRGDVLVVALDDGRVLRTPLKMFPRLQGARPEQLSNWEFIGKGSGIHWEDLDEDISIRGLCLQNGLTPMDDVASPDTDPKDFEEKSLRELRNAGYRVTMPRVQVIRALADSSRALSPYAIHERIISSGGKIDVVSVYRILSTLQEVGLVYHVGVADGYFPCRIPGGSGGASELFVSEETGEVTELILPKVVIEAIERQACEFGIHVSTIKIEITG